MFCQKLATIDGAAATYTKNGMQLAITITDSGEEKKVLLVEGGTYLTSSIFANHTFTGSFYDGWMESTSSLKIKPCKVASIVPVFLMVIV